MTRTTRTASWLSVAAAGALLLTACGGPAPGTGPAPAGSAGAPAAAGVGTNAFGGQQLEVGTPTDGGTLRFGISTAIESLDNANPIGSSIATVTFQIYDQLLKFDADGKVVPELAESMTSKDLKTWTMKLPTGVKFHDGTDFNAEAVIANVERIAAQGSKSLQSGDARRITKMEAPDAQTVVFTVDKEWATFDALFATGSTAMVASPTAVAKAGEKFGLAPVGVGPFKVASFSPGGEVKLEKFADYRLKDLPHLDALTFVPATENAARLSAVGTGDLDAAATRVAAQFDEARNAGLTVLEQPQYKAYSVLLNLSDPVLADHRVREALNAGVDRNALNAAVFGGKHQVMTGILNPTHPAYVDAGWPAFDPEKAKALVEEYEAEKGDINLDFQIPQGTEWSDMTAILQQMYAQVGIDIKYTAATPPSLVTAGAAGDYQVQLREPVILPETIGGIATPFATGAPSNHAHGSDPALDALLAKANATADPAERKALVADMQKELASWLPTVPLVSTMSGFMVGEDVQGFPGSFPNTSYEMFDAREVWVKK